MIKFCPWKEFYNRHSQLLLSAPALPVIRWTTRQLSKVKSLGEKQGPIKGKKTTFFSKSLYINQHLFKAPFRYVITKLYFQHLMFQSEYYYLALFGTFHDWAEYNIYELIFINLLFILAKLIATHFLETFAAVLFAVWKICQRLSYSEAAVE